MFAALLPCLGLLCGAPRQALCGPQDEITRRDWGIGNFRPPPRWEMQPGDRPTYPQLLAWASRGEGVDRAVMTLVAKRLVPGTSVQSFAIESSALQKVPGLRELHPLQLQTIESWGGHRVQLDGVIAGTPPKVFRQLFYINGDVGYVLTLVAPQSQGPPRLRDLEDTAANMVQLPIDTGARPALPPPSKPKPAAPPTVTPASPSERPH